MNLINHYWYFKSVLSQKFCEKIISYANKNKKQIALTGEQKNLKKLSKQNLIDLKKTRNSNVVWLNDQWIYDEIYPYIHTANKNAGWNFEFNYSESCQFTKYSKKQHYEWHSDSFNEPYNNPDNLNLHGKIRKLSVTCSLSDPKDYEGGELEFDFRNKNPDEPANVRVCEEIKSQGSIVVFPSHVWHRVKPVTKGIRYSLVIWNLGYPFK